MSDAEKKRGKAHPTTITMLDLILETRQNAAEIQSLHDRLAALEQAIAGIRIENPKIGNS